MNQFTVVYPTQQNEILWTLTLQQILMLTSVRRADLPLQSPARASVRLSISVL